VLFGEIPQAPSTPKYVARSCGDASVGLSPFITIKWEAPTETGGLKILGYSVSMKRDQGQWTLAYDGSTKPDVLEYKF
jgi:hypothetical protein